MKYYVKQKVFSLKDKFYIKDESQNDKYMVQGKMFSLTNQLDLMNLNEEVLLTANKRMFQFFPKYAIVDSRGEQQAVVKRLFGLRPKFNVFIGNETLEVQGSFFAHSFTIIRNGINIASIIKKVMAFGDAYEIEIDEPNNEMLYLFIVIIIDQTIHENKKRGFNV